MTAFNHRVLIIGVGSIGERHLRCFQNTNRAQVMLCEPNERLRSQVAERYQIDRAFGSIDDALAESFDVAVICTPAQYHIPLAVQLVDAGRHVLIEKPLSTTCDGIKDLIERVDRQGVVAGVAYVHRANPILAAMKSAIASGRFGRPVQVVATTGQHFPTYRPAYRDIYYAKHETGGGAIQDALTHIINAGEWLVGPIGKLVADADHLVLDGVDVEDTVHLLARHQGNVLGSYSLNQHQAPFELAITVVCEKGTCRFEPIRNRWRWMVEPDDDWHDECFAPLKRDELFSRQAEAFLDAVEGKAEPLCTLQEGLQSLRVNLAALQSVRDNDKFQDINHG